MKKRLKMYNISEKLYYDLLDYFKYNHTEKSIKYMDKNYNFLDGTILIKMDQDDFINGTNNKTFPLIDVNRQVICIKYEHLYDFNKKYPASIENCIKLPYKNYLTYQIMLRCVREQIEDKLILDYSPLEALKTVNKLLSKYYTSDEKKDLFKAHSLDKWNPQLHSVFCIKNKIIKIKNCYYYDINGAHTYLLSKIFPKAKSQFEYWNNHKHDSGKSYYKAIPNYYVGILGKEEKNYRSTYNWIINEVNKLMYKAFKETKNTTKLEDFIYVNTDGFIVNNPIKELETSNKLGEFKEVYKGDVYIYAGKNYYIIQYGDEIKGNLPLILRNKVDLREGRVVDFDKRFKDGIAYYDNVREMRIN